MKQRKQTRRRQTISEQLEARLVKAALAKLKAGQDPTVREAEALKRFEAAREEEQRWEYYKSIPQKHWRKMSGRQWKTITEQADRYGIPFGGELIDLTKVVQALHDFLARNARKLAAADDGDPLLSGDMSPALERYRDEKAKLARLDRLEREKVLLPLDQIHEVAARMAGLGRSFGDMLQRAFGPEGHRMWEEFIGDLQREFGLLDEGKPGQDPAGKAEP